MSATELIDVGDHRLAIARAGQGSPTVVLESGDGSSIPAWKDILPQVGEFTSVVAYARAGRDGSEPAKTPRTLTSVVDELRTMLQRAGYKPPYVLVGRSLGGIYIRAFAIRFPAEVAGLVLVDGSSERQAAVFGPFLRLTPEKYIQGMIGSITDEPARLEMEGLGPILLRGDLGLSGQLPDLPMIVLVNTRPEGPPGLMPVWRRLQEEVFQSTTRGMLILTNKSGHDIARKEPDLVVNSVRWVVETVRKDPAVSFP
jgi:pimeloyl-ACP methyl ester carboxylesterase